ncbi:hypothetical protein KC326_g99 [Hortaea werneckii]|nr:hypothetical protein KC326_g99 [Hortaea werneckii]
MHDIVTRLAWLQFAAKDTVVLGDLGPSGLHFAVQLSCIASEMIRYFTSVSNGDMYESIATKGVLQSLNGHLDVCLPVTFLLPCPSRYVLSWLTALRLNGRRCGPLTAQTLYPPHVRNRSTCSYDDHRYSIDSVDINTLLAGPMPSAGPDQWASYLWTWLLGGTSVEGETGTNRISERKSRGMLFVFSRFYHIGDEVKIEVKIEPEDERYSESLVSQPRQVAPGSRPPRTLGRFSSFA